MTRHFYSKKEIWLTVSIGILVSICFSILKASKNGYIFFETYSLQLKIFLGAFAGLQLFSLTYDYITQEDSFIEHRKFKFINIILWSIFWTSWGAFNSYIYINYKIEDVLFITSFVVLITVCLMCIVTHILRKAEIIEIEALKSFIENEEQFKKSFSHPKYYSGFYSILSILTYCIILFIYLFWQHPHS